MNHIKKSTKPTGDETALAPVIAAQFADPNQISAVSGWDLDIRQIGDGRMQTDVRVRPGKNISILDFTFSHRVHQIGASPAGYLTLGFPIRSVLSDWEGKSIRTPPFLSFGSGHEFDCVSESGFGGFTFTIDEEYAMQLGERLNLELPSSGFGTFLTQFFADPEHAYRVLTFVQALMNHDKKISANHEDELIEGLLRITVGSTAEHAVEQPRRSARAMSLAIERMTENSDEYVSINELCRDTGASLRTLERAFRDKFGVGPKAYYTRLRLGRVRTLLVESGSDVTISDAANRYGFWHIGQFARDYRRCFGHLPSETVKSTSKGWLFPQNKR